MSHASDKPVPVEWPDIAGRLVRAGDGTSDGTSHRIAFRVYFEDTDFSGLVYHATYVRWCERGRSDFLRLVGSEHKTLIDGASGQEPAAFVVRRMTLEFLKPARIDDIVEVETRVKTLTAATLVLSQRVLRAIDPIFTAEVTVVLVSTAGRVLRLSHALRSRLALPG